MSTNCSTSVTKFMGRKKGHYIDPTSIEVFVQVKDAERNYCDTSEERSGSAVSAKNMTLQHSMNRTKWCSKHAMGYHVLQNYRSLDTSSTMINQPECPSYPFSHVS